VSVVFSFVRVYYQLFLFLKIILESPLCRRLKANRVSGELKDLLERDQLCDCVISDECECHDTLASCAKLKYAKQLHQNGK